MKLEIGQSAEMSKCLDSTVVNTYAGVAEDYNPVHLDADFAATTQFGKPIVHGMLAASLLSGLLASKLPGPGSIYMAQELKFLRPIFVGENATARVTVTEIREGKPIVTLKTEVLNDAGKVAVTGKATALVPHLER